MRLNYILVLPLALSFYTAILAESLPPKSLKRTVRTSPRIKTIVLLVKAIKTTNREVLETFNAFACPQDFYDIVGLSFGTSGLSQTVLLN